MKQTAVDWLSELIECGADLDQIKKCIPRAKEMEKEQMSNAMLHGWRKALDEEVHSIDPNDFYNKTFKSE